jgi:hypothetical protein
MSCLKNPQTKVWGYKDFFDEFLTEVWGYEDFVDELLTEVWSSPD